MADGLLSVHVRHVERGTEHGQGLAEVLDPVVIDVELRATREGVPGARLFDVLTEGRVAPATRF